MGFLDDVKEVLQAQDKKIRVRRFLYDQLLENSRMDEQEAERLANKILADYFKTIEDDAAKKEAQEIREAELVSYYKYLDAYLKATIGRPIEIGITNALIGYETQKDIYTLSDYELSMEFRQLKMQLVQNDRTYPIRFERIEDIKFIKGGDRLKVWIYMPYVTWRFFIEYDPQLVIDFPLS